METKNMRLRMQIERSGLTSSEFAKATNIAAGTLSRLLNGKQKITEKYLQKAATILNVPVEYLLLETDEIHQPLKPKEKLLGNEEKEEIIKNIFTKLSCRIVEYVRFSNEPDIIYIREDENHFYKTVFSDLYTFAPLPEEHKTITQPELIKKIKYFDGDIQHNFRLRSASGTEREFDSVEFNSLLQDFFSMIESRFNQLFKSEYIAPLDTIIKYRNILSENDEMEKYISEHFKEE